MDKQLLCQDHLSHIWWRGIAGLGGAVIALPLAGGLAALRGAISDSKDEGVKNWTLR